MSDEQLRNDAGQFTEQKFGRAAELEASGFTEMPEPPKDEAKTYGSDDASLREAADEVAGRAEQQQPITPVGYKNADGERVDPGEAVTIERAASDLSSYRADTQRYVEGADTSALAGVVDAVRAETLKNNPKYADAYGLDPKEVEANAAKLDKASEETVAEPSEASEPAVDGLDPEVQKALKHPQVRQAIEEELGKAETAKQGYAQAINVAHQYAQASLMDHFPELAQLPLEQWAPAIGLLNQSDPERVARAMGVLQRVDHLQRAQGQWQQQQSLAQRQQFEAYAKAEDAKFDEMTKSAPVTKEVGDALIGYAQELGVDKATLFDLMQNNPVMRHSAFQKMMVDAARYQLVQKAVPKAIPKTVPPVQRPGTSTAQSARGSDDLRSLGDQFKASGRIDDAAKLLVARRAARG